MKYLMIAAIAMIAVGCSKPQVAEIESTGSASSARVPVGQPHTFTVPNASLYNSFTWSAIDPNTGADLSSQCVENPFPDRGMYTCTPSTLGELQVTVAARRISDGGMSSFTFLVDVIDLVNANQAPRIVISVMVDSNPSDYELIKMDQFDVISAPGTNTYVAYDQFIRFYLDETTDTEDATSALTYAISIDGSPFAPYTSGSVVTDLQDGPGSRVVTIRATDTDGGYSLRTFTMNMTCTAAELAGFVVNNGNITIDSQGDANVNIHTYDATNAVAGPRGDSVLRYSWDFNGDGYHDGVGSADTKWSANPVIDQVTLFDGPRTIRLRVLDLTCNAEAVSTPFTFNFDLEKDSITTVDAARAAYGMGVNYLQFDGDGSNTTGIGEREAHMDVSFKSAQGDTFQERDRINCSYSPNMNTMNRSGLSVNAVWDYQKSGDSVHGMEIAFTGIDHDTIMSFPTDPVDVTATSLTRAVYYSDMNEDDDDPFTYRNSGACTLTAQYLSRPDPGECNGEPSDGVIIEFWGTFNCPNMPSVRGGDTRNMAANDGAFYCLVGYEDACPAPPSPGVTTTTMPPPPIPE